MIDSLGFKSRIGEAGRLKGSRIILALDLADSPNLHEVTLRTISSLEGHICAVKLNFHLILPLSRSELLQVNRLAHSYGLQSIADVKLNDIPSTNEHAITQLSMMGFDAVTVNPFIGPEGLQDTVLQAHKLMAGVLALVYMSHKGARFGFGSTLLESNDHTIPIYQKFIEYSVDSKVDGIVVGANQVEILKEISCGANKIPIYSPGVGVQGGDVKLASESGTDYFIIGRNIVQSEDPVGVITGLREILDH
jgi:orotidine-5'-phosphate decarboxylase